MELFWMVMSWLSGVPSSAPIPSSVCQETDTWSITTRSTLLSSIPSPKLSGSPCRSTACTLRSRR